MSQSSLHARAFQSINGGCVKAVGVERQAVSTAAGAGFKLHSLFRTVAAHHALLLRPPQRQPIHTSLLERDFHETEHFAQ